MADLIQHEDKVEETKASGGGHQSQQEDVKGWRANC